VKIYSICTPSHRMLRDAWFLPSLCDGFPVEVLESEQTGDGSIGNEAFNGVMLQKVRLILRAIEEQWGDWFIYSDVDVQFLRPVRALAEQCLAEADICFQRDSPTGELCAGFFAARGCDSVRRLWQDVETHLSRDLSRHDQTWLNELLDPGGLLRHADCPPLSRWIWQLTRRVRLTLRTYAMCRLERWARLRIQSSYGVRIAVFPDCVFGAGTLRGLAWDAQKPFPVPRNACVHHANYATGIEAKVEQFQWVAQMSRRSESQV
jgi:hypothetical protein